MSWRHDKHASNSLFLILYRKANEGSIIQKVKMREEEVVELAKYILLTKSNNPEIDRKNFDLLTYPLERMSEKERCFLNFPIRILWKITGACNCRCKHCWAHLGGSPSKEGLLKLAKEIADNKPVVVSLSGGEPLLCNEYFDIYEILKEKNIIIETLTNGSLITEEWVKKYLKYAETDRDVIQISLDGSNAEIHDKQRSVSIFNKAVNAIKLLKKYKIKVRVSFTATEINQKDIYNTYCLCNSLGVDVMSITPVFPLRKGKDLYSGLDENIYLYEVLKCKRNELNTKTRVQVGFEFRNQIWEYRDNFEIQKYLKNRQDTYCLFMQETNTSVQIDSYGNVIPGPEYDENCHSAGNVYMSTLKDIWVVGNKWNEFRNGRNYANTKCNHCEIFNICGGGNAKVAYDEYGTINAPDGRCKLNEMDV